MTLFSTGYPMTLGPGLEGQVASFIHRYPLSMKRPLPFVTLAFIGLVSYLLYKSLSTIDWQEVRVALDQVSFALLVPSILMAVINYSILSSFDLLGMRHLKIHYMK